MQRGQKLKFVLELPSLSNLRRPPLMSSPWYGYADFTSVVGSRTKVPEQGGAHSRGRAGLTSA